MADGNVVWVTSDGVETFSSGNDLPRDLGAKARGLTWLPSAWVPTYFVIGPDIHGRLKSLPDADRLKFLRSLSPYFRTATQAAGIKLSAELLLRSNAQRETLHERGRFASRTSPADRIADTLLHLYETFDTLSPGESLGVIAQEYIPPIIKGHLSNERRVAEEYRDGLILLEDQSGSISEKRISFRKWRSGRDLPGFFGPRILRKWLLRGSVVTADV